MLIIMNSHKTHICAFRYLFGKDVDGTAYVVFGIIDQKNEKRSFRGSIQRVLVSIFPSLSVH